MRRLALLLITGGAVWLFLAALPVLADNGPHVRRANGLTADSCAGCHRAHTAANPMLTLDAQPALCYTCHGNGGTGSEENVQGGTAFNGVTGALRGGGVEYALLDTSNPVRGGFGPGNGVVGVTTQEATTSHHSVNFTDQVIWGNGPISGTLPNAGKVTELRCGSCHNPHGELTYRILRGSPVDSGVSGAARVYIPDVTQWTPGPTGTLGANQIPTGVLPAGAAYVYTQTNYWRPQDPNWLGSDYVAAPDTAGTNPNTIVLGADSKEWLGLTTQWCATCHTRYNAPSGAYEEDSGDAIFHYRHPTYAGRLGDPTAVPPIPADSSSAPACMQCHLSHGTNASMGTNSAAVKLPGSNTTPTETSRLLRVDSRGVCQLCHFR